MSELNSVDDVFNGFEVQYLGTHISKFSTSFQNSKFEYRDGNNLLPSNGNKFRNITHRRIRRRSSQNRAPSSNRPSSIPDGTVSTRRVSPGEVDVFAVLPGRPRRTLEGVHSTTVPHTALKSILASLSVRNLHRVVCRGSRTVDGKTRCLVHSSESGVAITGQTAVHSICPPAASNFEAIAALPIYNHFAPFCTRASYSSLSLLSFFFALFSVAVK